MKNSAKQFIALMLGALIGFGVFGIILYYALIIVLQLYAM